MDKITLNVNKKFPYDLGVLGEVKFGAIDLDLSDYVIRENEVHDKHFNTVSRWSVDRFYKRVSPEDLPLTKEKILKAYKEGPLNFECRVLSSFPPSTIWIRVSGQVFFDLQSNPIRMIGVVADITEKKRSEEENREMNMLLGLILENIPDMIFLKDAKDLKFVRFNKAGESLLGFTRSDLIGKNDFDFFPKDEATTFTTQDRTVFETRQLMDIEGEIHTKDKGVRIIHTKKIPIYNEDGTPAYLLGISEDITEKKKRFIEEELLENAKRMNDIIEHSLDAAMGMDHNDKITSWNAKCEEIFGWSKAEAIGKNLTDLIIPNRFKQSHLNGLQKFNKTGKGPILNKRVEVIALRRDGSEFPLELSVTPIKEDHTWIFFGFARDISDRKKMEDTQQFLLHQEHLAKEAAIQSINMRDDFLSIAAHELKTPITPLRLQLQILERVLAKAKAGQSPSPERDLSKIMQNSKAQLDRFEKLVDELLDVTRISAGRLVLNLSMTNVSSIIQSVLDRYAVLFKEAGVEVTTNLEPQIFGNYDAVRIEEVIENLVSNVVKYGNGKPFEINAKTENNMVILSFKDQGIGISEEDQGRIFNQFQRAASIKKYGGLGLGLYIARKIIEAHQGHLTVQSKLGVGSTFMIELPLK